MKWLSTKTHRPFQDGYCFLRTEHGSIYVGEWRNGCEDGEHADYSCGWMMLTLCEEFEAPSDIELFGVTHFCIPAAVEIED